MIITLIYLASALMSSEAHDTPPLSRGHIQDFILSQERSTAREIIKLIDGAQSSVLVFSYAFTSAHILRALNRAVKRGVTVSLLGDKKTFQKDQICKLRHPQITAFVYTGKGLQHAKAMVVDNSTVIMGSYNFTDKAEHLNSEATIILHSPQIAKKIYGLFLSIPKAPCRID